jgi:hypothetical protein
VARLVENLGRQPALSSTALQSNSDGWLSMAVAEAARGETWPVSWLVGEAPSLWQWDHGSMASSS